MKIYRVRDWVTLYENNRSRELKSLDWVPIPNKHDGERYSAIWQEEDGPDLFAAWILIVQVASKCGNPAGGCGARGTLMRNNGTPHTSQSLALITRAPPRIFIRALEYFANNGWLLFTENPALGCDNPAPACGKVPIEGKGTEGNRTISPKPAAPDGAVIDQIYGAYPRKVGKHGALRAITNLLKRNPPQFAPELLAKVQAYAAAVRTWPKEDAKFIPHPATWFNDARFDDDPETWYRGKHPIAAKPAAPQAPEGWRETLRRLYGSDTLYEGSWATLADSAKADVLAGRRISA